MIYDPAQNHITRQRRSYQPDGVFYLPNSLGQIGAFQLNVIRGFCFIIKEKIITPLFTWASENPTIYLEVPNILTTDIIPDMPTSIFRRRKHWMLPFPERRIVIYIVGHLYSP